MKFNSSGYLVKEGLKNIWTNRMMSLASVIVLVSCLIITGAAILVSVNVTSLISSIGDDNQVNVFLEYDMSDIDAIKLGTTIKKIDNVEDCQYYSKDEAIKEYKDKLGNLYESLQGEDNPLGNVYKVRLADLSNYKQTIKEIEAIDGVASVSDRGDIARTLTKLNYFVTIVGFWIVMILGVVTLFIISNTIKMTMYSRRYEISIMKSVGATNTFVRIPFIIEAMAIGLISGLIASVALIAIYNPIRETAGRMITLIGTSTIPISDIWLNILLGFSGAGILIGALGGSISISKYLRKEGGDILGW